MGKKNQLFLLHFAGGSCYSFDFLRSHFNTDIEFISLEIPGRGKRFGEELLKTKESVIQDYFNQIRALRNNEPYLIYGHSMGATLGLSVTNKMEEVGDSPKFLIVTGNAGPGLNELEGFKLKRDKLRYSMCDDDFKAELKELGGVPEKILNNPELYNFFAPIIRADFEVLETDNYLEKKIYLNTPIHAIMGSEEKTSCKVQNWSRFTSGEFTSEILSGNHFFIYNYPNNLAKTIQSCYDGFYINHF